MDDRETVNLPVIVQDVDTTPVRQGWDDQVGELLELGVRVERRRQSVLASARKCWAASACLRAVMSRAIFEAPTILPELSWMGEMVRETSSRVLSLCSRWVS